MAGRASALAVLGLEPGADTAAIERAYKRLIKQHHPDREGGDGGRAAEITRAYRELRGGQASSDPLQFNEDFAAARTRARWPVAALAAGAAIGGLLVAIGPSDPLIRTLSAARAQLPLHHGTRAMTAQDAIGEPLHNELIDNAVHEAVYLFRTKDEMALASASRECQRRFRDDPGTGLLDRCAAFDDAVIGLEDRDPLRDGGPFAPLAVTGRQWSAASALSEDYLAIDSRLDQIRLRVEIALTPQVPPLAPANSNNAGD
ncbi:MAG: J domain-containing protein [Sphingomonas sp.]